METKNKKVSLTTLILILISFWIIPAFILFISGDWLWLEGWIFGLWFISMCYSTIIYMYVKDPALLAERSSIYGAGEQKPWDRFFTLFMQIGFFIWITIMPLDVKRYGWTKNFPLWLKIVGLLALIFSLFFIYRSVVDNTFASTLVRIQKERNQRVISTGVYGFVRHPMYLGAVLLCFGAPLLIGSLFGLIFSVLFLIVLILRTIGEEKMLVNELEGYLEYKKKVKYRIIPLVW